GEQCAVVVGQRDLARALGIEDRVEPSRRAQLDLLAEFFQRSDQRVERAPYREDVRLDVDGDRRHFGAREGRDEVGIGQIWGEVRVAAELLDAGAGFDRDID